MYNSTVEKISQYFGMDADGGKDLLKLSAYKDIGVKISSLMAGGSSRIAADFARSLHNRVAVGTLCKRCQKLRQSALARSA